MIKLFLTLSIVAMAVSLFFGMQNRKEFIKERKIVEDTDSELMHQRKMLADEETDLEDTQLTLTQTKSARDEGIELLRVTKEELNVRKQELVQVMRNIASKEREKQDIQNILDKLPPGVTLATVNSELTRLEDTSKERQARQKELEEMVGAAQRKIEGFEKLIEGHKEYQADRSTKIAANRQESVISAVNADWGFVVVSAGSNRGVAADSEFIVKRGSERIGKLRVSEISPNSTVANIIADSISVGTHVQPGDRVIFERVNN